MIDKIQLNPKNPRTISKEAFEKLKDSIRSFPQMLELRPIVYDANYMVLGGNMRFRALQDLAGEGFEVKDSYFKAASDLTDEQKREFVIKDNIANGDWDYEALANEWSDLPLADWGVDIPKWKEETEEDEAPAVPEVATSKVGEIYQLGRHRLICGDSANSEDIAKLIGDNKIDMVFTDPPYGVDYVSRVDEDRRKNWGGIKNDNLKGGVLQQFLKDTVSPYLNIPLYVCCNWQSYPDFNIALGTPNSLIVWDKESIGLGAGYRNQHEFILFYGKLNHNSESNLWRLKRDSTSSYTHPTQKPVALSARAMGNHDGANVLDLFAGSGSTLIACEQLNKNCFAVELDPKYCDVIRKRFWKFTSGDESGWVEGTPVL